MYQGAVVVLSDTGRSAQSVLQAASSGAFESQLNEADVLCVFPATENSLQEALEDLKGAGVPQGRAIVGGLRAGGSTVLRLLADDRLMEVGGAFSLGVEFDSVDTAARCLNGNASSPPNSSASPVWLSWPPGAAGDGSRQGPVAAQALRHLGHSVTCWEASSARVDAEQVQALLEWIFSTLSLTLTAAAPSKGASSKGGASSRGVRFEISAGEAMEATATFFVPVGSEAALASAAVTTRGSFFELRPGSTPGTVTTTFSSPTPEVTAEAVAARISRRLQDPHPPGAAEACAVS